MTQKDGDLSVRDEDIQIPSFDTKIFCSLKRKFPLKYLYNKSGIISDNI